MTYARGVDGRAGSSVDLTKGGVAGVSVGVAHDGVIEGVEHFKPELQVVAFADGEVLGEAGVDVECGRTVDHVPCTVAEGAIRSRAEGCRVEVALEPIRSAALTHL